MVRRSATVAGSLALVLALVLVALPVVFGIVVVRVVRRIRNGDFPIQPDVIDADKDTDG